MGLSNFPSSPEGIMPILVMNTVLSVALVKNILKSLMQIMSSRTPTTLEDEMDEHPARERRVSITQFKSLCKGNVSSNNGSNGSSGGWGIMECCVCLCRFEANEEVSELSCKHFFHKRCLDKWFNNKRTSCPLCRSSL